MEAKIDKNHTDFLDNYEMCSRFRDQVERQVLMVFYLNIKAKVAEGGANFQLSEAESAIFRRNNQVDLDFDAALQQLLTEP